MNGDILAEIDFNAMKSLHESKDALATIALHEVVDPTRFGVAKLDEDLRIREFIEKPKLGNAPSRLVNAGAYLLEPQAIDRIPEGRKVIIEREVFPALASEGKLLGYVHSGTWFDIGNISDFLNANFTLLKSKTRGGGIVAEDAEVSPSASFAQETMIGDHATVEDGAKLGPLTIIGRRARIRRNAGIAGTVVFDDAEIGSESSIQGSVIGNSVSIGKGVTIEQGSVIAGYTRIRDNVHITRDVYIHPYKEIDKDIQGSGHVV
jgi:NDP-sugar pyrophosphorylase family protein